jgi:hypothetical protein
VDAQEFYGLMRLAWHELRTPVSVVGACVGMLRAGRAGLVDGGIDAVLAQIEPNLQRLSRLVSAIRGFGDAYTVVEAIDVCAAFVPGLIVKASDEARIVAAPLDGFAAHLLTLLLSLPGSDNDAFTVTAEVLVTPERCRVFFGPVDRSARKDWRHAGVMQQACARLRGLADSVAALQKAGCTVTFCEHSSGTGLIKVRWTRPLTNLHRGR